MAVAYRQHRRLSAGDQPARQTAEAAFRERHPTTPEREAQDIVGLMIAAVARDHAAWFWKGVGAVTD